MTSCLPQCQPWARAAPLPTPPSLLAAPQPTPTPTPAVTGQVMYVDNGLSVMGLATDSKTLDRTAA